MRGCTGQVVDPDTLPFAVFVMPWATNDIGDLTAFRDETTAAQRTFSNTLDSFMVEACRETSLAPSGCLKAFAN